MTNAILPFLPIQHRSDFKLFNTPHYQQLPFGHSHDKPAEKTTPKYSLWKKMKTFTQDYGPYAVLGMMTSAIGIGAYQFADGYTQWLSKTGFPIEKWPNTLAAPHDHGAHTAHDNHDHSGHNHDHKPVSPPVENNTKLSPRFDPFNATFQKQGWVWCADDKCWEPPAGRGLSPRPFK